MCSSPVHERFLNGVLVVNDIIVRCSQSSSSSSSVTSHQPGPETAPAVTSSDDVDAAMKLWCRDRSRASFVTSSAGSDDVTPSGLLVTSASALLGGVNEGESTQPSVAVIIWQTHKRHRHKLASYTGDTVNLYLEFGRRKFSRVELHPVA